MDDPVIWFRATAANASTSAETDTASEVNTVRSVGSDVTLDSSSRSRWYRRARRLICPPTGGTTPDRRRPRWQARCMPRRTMSGAGMDQLADALAQRERRSGDEHAEGRDQPPEVGFSPVPEGMLVVGRAAAATLSNQEEHVVGGIGECFCSSGSYGRRTSENRRADLGQRDPKIGPDRHQYGPRAIVRHRTPPPACSPSTAGRRSPPALGS